MADYVKPLPMPDPVTQPGTREYREKWGDVR